MKILDCPNFHSFCKEDTKKLFSALSKCDISIFSHRSVQALIEYSWESTRLVFIGFIFLPFLGYVATYMVFLETMFKNKDVDEESKSQHNQLYMAMTQMLLFVFAIYLIQMHIRSLIT